MSSSSPYPVKRLTPGEGQWFFGYYDIPAFSRDGARHLCHRAAFRDRLPRPEDEAELGVADLRDGSLRPFARTRAWNFQQGSLLRWHPVKDGFVLYNDWREGRYAAVERDVDGGAERIYTRPFACVDPEGRYALSVNFDRMYDFRPGYGYCQQPDPWGGVAIPEDDGVWRVDLATGEERLALSYAAIFALVGSPLAEVPRPKLLVNHITCNADGTRFVLLVRNFPAEGGDGSWRTAVLTAEADGSNPYLLSDWGYASHYHWRDAEVIAFHSGGAELGAQGPQLYELRDRTHEGRAIDPVFFPFDGHNSYSPDRTLMLYDSYPGEDGLRSILLYDLARRRGLTLGSFYNPVPPLVDIRCDPHPRWSPDGRSISFDSGHEGFRGVYLMEIGEAIDALRG